MNCSISTDYILEYIKYLESFEDICNLALVNDLWYEVISSQLRNEDFINHFETLSINNLHKRKSRLDDIIFNTSFPNIRTITIETIEFDNKIVEYIIGRCKSVEYINVMTNKAIPNSVIKELCAKLEKLKKITVKQSEITKSINGRGCSHKELKERDIIIRRPKKDIVDYIMTEEGTIRKYLDFYTQSIYN